MLGYRWCFFSAGPWLSEHIWLSSSVVGMAFVGGWSWVLEATSVKTKVHRLQILWVVSDALVLGIVARIANRRKSWCQNQHIESFSLLDAFWDVMVTLLHFSSMKLSC